jgi:DNA-binding MarR family transcriptional regulator/GNAT superfamily N-acetyltransferase
MADPDLLPLDLEGRIAAVRRFSRFYTRRIGVLQERLLDSPFSLTEGRIFYELAQRDTTTAAELAKELGLDPGYLSRILRGFEERGLIERQPAQLDARQNLVRLSASGRAAFIPFDASSREQIAAMLKVLTIADQHRLVDALQTVEALIEPERQPPFRLRPHRPGDIGWVIQRHGTLYARDYGWDESFEALVAEVAAQFIRSFDPAAERCWIAEKDGEPVGSVFLVRQSEEVAKLRLLIVEPQARGLGIGERLVAECIAFARKAGYRRVTLWTNSVLVSARRLYEAAGFRLTASEPHRSFGHDLVAETWDLEL